MSWGKSIYEVVLINSLVSQIQKNTGTLHAKVLKQPKTWKMFTLLKKHVTQGGNKFKR